METLSIKQLTLTYFRNYPYARLTLDPTMVVLTGHNGAGKTSILEALSFLAPGRGLRQAPLQEIDCRSPACEEKRPWAVAACIRTSQGECVIGTGREEGKAKRVVKCDGQPVRSHTKLSQLCSIVWLTPTMDSLFIEGASVRRRFLDRLVYHLDPLHAERVASYEQAMRERLKLLKEGRRENTWIQVLEQRMAADAVAIAAAREETVGHINQAMQHHVGPFPKALLSLDGEIEANLKEYSALQVEEQLALKWAEMRGFDAKTGRTNTGIHRSDLVVCHALKGMPASLCSTGEQKALLLAIILADIRARCTWQQSVPIVLLDEVVAHLDVLSRDALFTELWAMQAQAWLTGTDDSVFAPLQGKAQFFKVNQGTVQPIYH